MKKLSLVTLAALFLGMAPLFAQTTYYSLANGNWNAASTWSTAGFGGAVASTPPSSTTDIINIGDGFTVTITGATASCATISIANTGILNVGNGITVSGATTIASGGTLNISATAGTKTFNGLVTISLGAVWSEAVNEAINFRGGITNNGTFTAASGNHNFTATQTVTGNLTIPRFVVSGANTTVTNSGTITSNSQLTVTGSNANLINNGTISAQPLTISTVSARITNNGTLTIGGTLSGAGTASFPQIIQGANSFLYLNGNTPAGPTLTVTINTTGTPNTVSYGGDNQTVLDGSYNSLGLTGSGIKTFQAAIVTISGNVSFGGTAIASGPSATLNFNGTTTQTISGTGSFSVNNITLSGTGTKSFGVPVAVASTFAIGTGTIAGLTNPNAYTANAMTISGGTQGAGTYGSMASAATYQTDSFFSGDGLIDIATGSLTYYSVATGFWTSSTTWSTLGFAFPTDNFGTFPKVGDAVNLGTGVTVTVTGAQVCGALAFSAANTGTTTLDVTGTSLTAGAISIPRPTSGSGSNFLTVATGTLNASSLSFTGTTGGVQQLAISTGSVSVSGDVTSANVSGTIQFTGAGSMSVGGNMFAFGAGTLTTVAGSTFGYNGSSAQTVQRHQYYNLEISGVGLKSSTTGTTNLGTLSPLVPGNLYIADNATLEIGNAAYNVYGTTTVGNGLSGSLRFVSSTNGAKTFRGLVTIMPGATWDDDIDEDFAFIGGITNQGTFIAGNGTYTFNTSSQSITGVPSIPNLTVSGSITLTLNGTLVSDNLILNNGNTYLTNNGNLTVNTSLSGAGAITQNASSTLTIVGTMSLTAPAAMVASDMVNTVSYTGADQTIASGNYYHLNLDGSGIKTMQAGTTIINGDLTASGTVSFTGVAGLTIGGNVSLGSSTTFTPSSYSYTVGGNWASNGILTGAGSTITFNGPSRTIFNSATTLFYNVAMAGTGTKTLTSAIVTDGNFAINSGAMVDLGTFSSAAGTLTIFGTSQPSGQHGSTPATFPNDLAFASNPGILNVGGLVYYSRATGNWNTNTTWSLVSHTDLSSPGTIPSPNDQVVIGGNDNITVTANATCKTLSFNATNPITGNEGNNLIVNTGVVLTVTTNVTIPRNTNLANYLNVNAGTLNAENVLFTNGIGSGSSHRLQVTTGTVNVTGNITSTGVSGLISISGAGLLRVYGSIPPASGATGLTLTLSSTSTVEYAGADQVIRDSNNNGGAIANKFYGNLSISGSGIKTWTLGNARTINGNLIVNSGTTLTTLGNPTLAVTGTTTISGTVNLGGTDGKTFTGDVTLNNGAEWNMVNNAAAFFTGNFTNNATTFTSGTGLYTFSGTSKVFTGVSTIQNMAVTNSYTNNGLLTVTALSGSGSLTNGATGTLNLDGSVSLNSLDASASGNTVEYRGTGSQIVVIPVGNQYSNLVFNNTTPSGIATPASAGSTILVSGNWTNNGAVAVGGFYGFNPNGGTVEFNGSGGQSIQGAAPSIFYNLTAANTSSSVTLVTSTTVNNTLSIQSGDLDNTADLLTMGNGATLDRNIDAALIGNAPIAGTPPVGNSYNLIYSGTGSGTTGLEAEGSFIKDVTIGLTGTLIQDTPLDLYGIMLVNLGATYDPGVNLLTVKSWNDVGTDAGGSIGQITGTFMDNPVKVERFFRAKDNVDRFISSPVAGATIEQLQNTFAVTGDFTGSSYDDDPSCTGCSNNGSSLRWYKESVSGVLSKGYQGYPGPSGSKTSTLKRGVGYDAYMWNGVNPMTITFNGFINQGPVPALGTATGQVVSRTSNNRPNDDGWNLVGNPYPAPITWTGQNGVGGWTLNNIEPVAWAWDVYNEGWIAIRSTVPDPLVPYTDQIAIGQAFWVRVIAGQTGGTINITEAAKSTARSGAYYRKDNDQMTLKVNLSRGDVTESAFLVMNENATTQYQHDKDFSKIELGIESMHMTLVKENYHLGFYALTETWTEDIPVRIVAEEEGLYELSFETISGFTGLTDYYLVDAVSQERMAFNSSLKYSFTYSKKHPEQRFVLTRKTDAPVVMQGLVQAYPNPTTGKLAIAVNNNEVVRDIVLISSSGEILNAHVKHENGSFNLSLDEYPSGVYLVKIALDAGVVVKRIIKY